MFLSNSLFKVGYIVAGDYCVLKWCDYLQGKTARTGIFRQGQSLYPPLYMYRNLP